jgi:hypothetical protein
LIENNRFRSSQPRQAPERNKVLPKAGLNGFDWTFVQGSTFVLRLNFCAKNPRLRQYPKRYKDKQTPLDYALSRANNIDLVNLVEISEILLQNTEVTQEMRNKITRRGEDFEFHRENFNKDYLKETDNALNRLYEMYQVPPVKKRIMHDGVSPIIVSGTTWQKQFEELWELLIPSNGSAKTIQGEVVRIAGKVRDEIYRNGGGNWNIDFKKMLDAFLTHLATNNALSVAELEKSNSLVQDIRKNGDAETDELNYLCELATKWVVLNPTPILLEKSNYKR